MHLNVSVCVHVPGNPRSKGFKLNSNISRQLSTQLSLSISVSGPEIISICLRFLSFPFLCPYRAACTLPFRSKCALAARCCDPACIMGFPFPFFTPCTGSGGAERKEAPLQVACVCMCVCCDVLTWPCLCERNL